MKKSNDNWQFILLCCLVYFTSYMTRYNYSSIVNEMVNSMGLEKSVVGFSLTLSFITYGVGQLVSGYLGDKISPRKLIAMGLLVTACCNIAVGAVSSIYVIYVIWALNGFAQAFLWPPLVKIMIHTIAKEKYGKANSYVITASQVATVLVYVLASICAAFASWNVLFFICGTLAVIVSAVWLLSTKDIKEPEPIVKTAESKEDGGKKLTVGGLILSAGLIPILIAIVMQGMIRDGITAWVPSYITEEFNLSVERSILTSSILPVFAILSVGVTRWLRGRCKTELHTTILLWGISIVCAAGLLIFHESQLVISVLLMALMTACAHGINLMLICDLPARFVKYGNVSFASGLLNSCTYIGSALSTYGIALLSDEFGWNTTIIAWCVIAVVGLLTCVFATKKSSIIKD